MLRNVDKSAEEVHPAWKRPVQARGENFLLGKNKAGAVRLLQKRKMGKARHAESHRDLDKAEITRKETERLARKKLQQFKEGESRQSERGFDRTVLG